MCCHLFKSVVKYCGNLFTCSYKEPPLLFLDISYKSWLSWCILSLRIILSRSFWTLCWFCQIRMTCTLFRMFNSLMYFSGRETAFLIAVFLASSSYGSWELPAFCKLKTGRLKNFFPHAQKRSRYANLLGSIWHLILFWRRRTALLHKNWNMLCSQECAEALRYRYTCESLFHTSAVIFTLLIYTSVGILLECQDLNDWSLATMSGSLLIATESAYSLHYLLQMGITKLFTWWLWVTAHL